MIDETLLSAQEYSPNPYLPELLLLPVIRAKKSLYQRALAKKFRSQHITHFRFDDHIWVVAHPIYVCRFAGRAAPDMRRLRIVILYQRNFKLGVERQTHTGEWETIGLRRFVNPYPYRVESVPDPDLVIIFNHDGVIIHGENTPITFNLEDANPLS